MRAVVDTSVWVSGVYWTGLPHRLLQRWRDGEFEAIVSPALLAELERALGAVAHRIGANPDLAEEWMDLITSGAELVHPGRTVLICRDPADNAVLEAAVAGQVDCIISGDRDLTDLGEHCGVRILTPRQFADLLGIAD